jgi:arylesterase/paraoxonase
VLWYFKYPKYAWDEKAQLHQLQMDGLNVTQWMNFHPLGLGYRAETRTLYVVNHAQYGPSIEVFEVNKQVTGITHQRTITHPLLHTPNSVTPISNHEVYITNDHKYEIRKDRIHATLETYLSYPGGTVVYMNFKTNTTRIVAKDIPFANGVTVLNSTHLAVASTTTPSVSIFSISPTTRALTLKMKISVPFWVDNLKTDSSRTLLMAGHPWAPAVSKIAKTNHLYKYIRERAEGLPLEERPRAPSWVAEWDGNREGRIKDLYVGSDFGTSTSVVRDVNRGIGFVGGLYERGVMMFRMRT